MTSPKIEEVLEESLTSEAQAARDAADAREAAATTPAAPAMKEIDVRTLLSRRERWRLWWWGVRLKLVGRLNRVVGIVPVRADDYHAAMAEFARLFSYLEKSGALPQKLRARQRIEAGLYRALQHLATGEQLADKKSYQASVAGFAKAREASRSHAIQRQRNAAALTLVKAKLARRKLVQLQDQAIRRNLGK